MTISDTTLRYWAERADRIEKARHATQFIQDDGCMPMTQGWSKYRPQERLVTVTDAWGKQRWITPRQNEVLNVSRILRSQASMTAIAASLGFATSTVSRALLRLASMGLVAFNVRRGRNGGVTFIHVIGKELERRAQGAWERLKRYRLKANERVWERAYERGYPRPVNVATNQEGTQRLAMAVAWTASMLAEMGL